ncbi:hypothetical protein HUF15_32930 [Streptomyces samsunensis]|uniref:Secreted protein n=1 Tax=Streptomyces autolyticus TaxID=75293 RepID=A0ABM6HEF1_9ACTN|nr:MULTISPECIES: hypothetical protein [Streptomyces]MCC4318176.1 hypothetical protein [Streptomyces malaysiensis]AQA12311.1 hypothetical protein BV401_19465 [Streptomyces autolyticus]MCD9590348.1 hypothetical protein [Streptomyces sp. 8ZJF_21]MCQ6249909.1 hypothetical protein [Streptomyces malaysiensis]NUH41483.1 hypothetical protein [Streptomyces samsunensis]
MSPTTLALLLAAAAATAVGAAALHTARGVRRQISELRAELAATVAAGALTGGGGEEGGATVPAPRTATPAAEIRAAVADALAEERERELAEARAFWAAQEARDSAGAADAHSLLGGPGGFGEDSAQDAQLFVPRQADLAGLEPLLGLDALGPEALDPAGDQEPEVEAEMELELGAGAEPAAEPRESAELAAARRRHPSHPDFTPPSPVADHDRTVTRLTELAEARTPLADVRPGPLGTLDVYVFADGTTICMTPGHRETAERLADALREGTTPVLLGGSGVSGAYALTFGCGEENVYVLADRVIASL